MQECRVEFEKDRLRLLDCAEAAQRGLQAELTAERAAVKQQMDAHEMLVCCCLQVYMLIKANADILRV